MKVIVSEQVRAFLAAEKIYLRKHSSTAFRRLSDRLREASRTLSRFPFAGSRSPLPVPGLHRYVVDDYVLDYEVTGNEIRILHIRHGRQCDPYLDYDDDADFEDR